MKYLKSQYNAWQKEPSKNSNEKIRLDILPFLFLEAISKVTESEVRQTNLQIMAAQHLLTTSKPELLKLKWRSLFLMGIFGNVK